MFPYSRRIQSTITRLGNEVDVLTPSTTGLDEFNNPESEWTKERTARCVRTYPNRNTEVESGGGRYHNDRPLFIFEAGEAPGADDRIRYQGTLYEMKSLTEYDSHVAVFGEKVTN